MNIYEKLAEKNKLNYGPILCRDGTRWKIVQTINAHDF